MVGRVLHSHNPFDLPKSSQNKICDKRAEKNMFQSVLTRKFAGAHECDGQIVSFLGLKNEHFGLSDTTLLELYAPLDMLNTLLLLYSSHSEVVVSIVCESSLNQL